MSHFAPPFDSNIYLSHLNDPVFYFGPHRNQESGYENDYKNIKLVVVILRTMNFAPHISSSVAGTAVILLLGFS